MGIREYTGGAYEYRPRVVFISTEGIPRIPYKASGLTMK